MIFKMLALGQLAEKWPFSAGRGGGLSDRSDPPWLWAWHNKSTAHQRVSSHPCGFHCLWWETFHGHCTDAAVVSQLQDASVCQSTTCIKHNCTITVFLQYVPDFTVEQSRVRVNPAMHTKVFFMPDALLITTLPTSRLRDWLTIY